MNRPGGVGRRPAALLAAALLLGAPGEAASGEAARDLAAETGLAAGRGPGATAGGEAEGAAWIGELIFSFDPEPAAWSVRVWGRARLWLARDPGGHLTGRIDGTQEQEIEVPAGPLAPRCAHSLAPTTFGARLEASRPEPGRLVILLGDPQPAQGPVAGCGPAPGILHPGPLVDPVLAELLAGLSARPDGSYAVRLERAMPGGPTRLVHRYQLQLRPDCLDPDVRSGRFERSPFGPEMPADIAPACGDCPGGRWQLALGEVSWHPAAEPLTCAYVYEAVWRCSATDAITKRTRTLVLGQPCVPRG